LIDKLNRNGRKIGIIDKAIAHKKGIWHKSVHVWIVNDENQILLQQRCSYKKFFPNVWDCSFAGHVGAGETSIISAIREGQEELGIDVDTSKMEFLFTNKEKLKYGEIISNEFVDVYLLKDNIKIDDLVYQETEVGGAKYMTLSVFFETIKNNKEELFQHADEYAKLKEIFEERHMI